MYNNKQFKKLELDVEGGSIARSIKILGWEGVGNRQLLCFFKA
jgi:hypothetical protein